MKSVNKVYTDPANVALPIGMAVELAFRRILGDTDEAVNAAAAEMRQVVQGMYRK